MSAVLVEAETESDRTQHSLALPVELNGNAVYLNYQQLTALPCRLFDEDVRRGLLQLYAQHNMLGSLPPEIKSLQHLRELYLKSNRLEVLPEELCDLPHLETLGLSDNQLTCIPRCISRLRNLRRLRLARNKLTHLPAELGGLRRLQTLEVSHNRLRVLPAEVGLCGDLQQLCVDSNHLASLPRQLCHLSRLWEISACHNQLLSLPQDLGRMSALQAVYVDDNCCLRVVPASLLHKTVGFCRSGQSAIPEHVMSVRQHIVLGSGQGGGQRVVVPLPPEILSVGELGSNCVPSLLELALRHVSKLCQSSAIRLEEGELPADLLCLLRCPTGHCHQCGGEVFVCAFPAVFSAPGDLHPLLLLGLCCSVACVRQCSLLVRLPLLYPRLEDLALALVVA